MIYDIIINQKELDKKLIQCVAICNTLIKNNFRRPYNLSEDIVSCY